MPEHLKVHSGERVDLADYVVGANGYTQDMQKFELERMLLDRRSRIMDGFRVQVEDQAANPGMITVYNGNAVDRNGQLVNNENVVNDSRSITLLGANLNFYVEIEFIENETKTDTRFFWDPTIANTPPEPDGSEFGLNVATRISADWRIVNPVSTTSFDQTANPASVRIPVGVFRTDGSNKVVVGGTNPGLTLVTAASVLESDTAVGVNTVRVLDCGVFPATLPFNVTVDLGGTTPEARTVTAIDRTNGLLTVSVNLAATHKAGAIVRVTSGSSLLVKQKTDPSDPALDPLLATPGHPDPAQRLWQANEVRGGALTTSKETFGARDDLNIRSLKDQLDALASQLRELKFGHARPEIVATAPPLAFGTRPRWFDPSGSVTGARTNSLSIGNGTTSFGDLNTTGFSDASAMLTAAIAALPAAGGTIFVKAGTYSLPTQVSITKPVVFVGESYNSAGFSSTNAGGAAITTTAALRFENMFFHVSGGSAVNILDVTAAINVQFHYAVFIGQIRLVNVNAGVIGVDSSFVSSGANSVVIGSTITSKLTNSRFERCFISATGFFIASSVNDVVLHGCYGSALAIYELTDGSVTNLVVTDCQMTITSAVAVGAGVTGAVSGVRAQGNRFTIPALPLASYVFGFWNTADVTEHVHVLNNYFNVTGGTTSSVSPGMILWLKNTHAGIDIHMDDNAIDCAVGSFVVGAQLDQRSIVQGSFSRNYINRAYEMCRVGGPVAGMTGCDLEIVGNYFNEQAEHDNTYGVRLLSDPGITRLLIRDNIFTDLGNSSGVGIRIAVELTNTYSGLFGAKYDVSGNTCFLINAGNDESHFVRFTPGSSGNQDTFNIENNFVEGITSPTVASGIYIAPAGTNIGNVRICNNRVDSIGDSGTGTLNGFGIYVGNQNSISALAPSVLVSGNTVFSVYGAAIATGIHLSNCGPAIVTQNTVTDVECDTGVVNTAGCGIRFTSEITNSKCLKIMDNIVDQGINTTASAARHCIVVYIDSFNLTGFSVDRNDCRSSTGSTGHVIWLYSAGAPATGGFIDGSVSTNTVVMRMTTASVSGIVATIGSASLALKVDGNTVQETTYGANIATHKGIVVSSSSAGPRAVSVCNNTLTGVKAGALVGPANTGRVGIQLRGSIAATVVTSNIVDWNDTDVVPGIGIQYLDDLTGGAGPWRHHVCNSNLVTGDNSDAPGYEIDIDTAGFSHGYAIGNNLGTPAHAGKINPAAPIAGWDYGASLGAGAPYFCTYNGLNKLT